MTCLALGLKGGALGAVGLTIPVGEAKALEIPPVSSEARAILPMPTPQSEKNCRRVMRRRSARFFASWDGSKQFICTYSFVTVSSRFKTARQTVVQAASSGSSIGDLSSDAPATL